MQRVAIRAYAFDAITVRELPLTPTLSPEGRGRKTAMK